MSSQANRTVSKRTSVAPAFTPVTSILAGQAFSRWYLATAKPAVEYTVSTASRRGRVGQSVVVSRGQAQVVGLAARQHDGRESLLAGIVPLVGAELEIGGVDPGRDLDQIGELRDREPVDR
jgi:hypothetical protein